MRKIGKARYISFILLWLAAGPGTTLFAQPARSVTATVSATEVFTGERLQLNITISGDFSDVKRPDLPDFKGLQLLSSVPSTSRSISYVNGVTRSSYIYSYMLSAPRQGTYTIPPVSVSVDGTTYKTEAIEVKVLDRNKAASENVDKQPDIFLKLKVSDQQPVVGQQVLASIILYFKEGMEVSSYQPIPGWKAEGFWKEELGTAQRPQIQSTIINGVRFRSARLLQFALFPTKSGTLTVSPYKIDAAIRTASQREDPFSSFFGGFGNNRRQVELETDPVTINVKDLPPISDAHYIGAVGSYRINREMNIKRPTVGETIEVKTTIEGTGNIPLLNKPEYDFPEDLEVYDPQKNIQLDRSGQRIRGTVTYTDIVIARTPGRYTIPETTLAYYNPDRGKYITETLPARTFKVKRNPDTVTETGQPNTISLQPVTGLANWVSPAGAKLWNLWWLWAGLLVPIAVLTGAYWQKSYRDRMQSDVTFARAQKANALADKRLQQALDHSKNGRVKEAYNALQKSLTGFIGDRLGLPEAGLSIEQYVSALEEHNVDEDLIKNVRMLLNKCATINYAPNATHDYLKSHVGLAQSIIEKLKNEL